MLLQHEPAVGAPRAPNRRLPKHPTSALAFVGLQTAALEVSLRRMRRAASFRLRPQEQHATDAVEQSLTCLNEGAGKTAARLYSGHARLGRSFLRNGSAGS